MCVCWFRFICRAQNRSQWPQPPWDGPKKVFFTGLISLQFVTYGMHLMIPGPPRTCKKKKKNHPKTQLKTHHRTWPSTYVFTVVWPHASNTVTTAGAPISQLYKCYTAQHYTMQVAEWLLQCCVSNTCASSKNSRQTLQTKWFQQF